MTETNPTQAPLTPDERTILRMYAKGERPIEFILWLLLTPAFCGLICYVPLYILWRLFGPLGANDRTIMLIAAAIAGVVWSAKWVWGSIIRRIERRDKPNPYRGDLDRGVANVMLADVTRAVEIEQYEDEGTGFFLELADNRVLCVLGQDMDDYSDDATFDEDEENVRDQFPQTRIQYRYAPESGYRLNLKGIGDPLRPFGRVKTTRKFFKKDGYTGPNDGEFYDGPVEATLTKFGYKLKLAR